MARPTRFAFDFRELLLLAAGLAGALLLVWTAFVARERARWRGQAEFGRLAAAAQARVEAAWLDWVEDREAPAGARFSFPWGPAAGPSGAVEAGSLPVHAWSGFELEWLSLVGSAESREARLKRLTALLEAVPEAPQRAEGLLLALQLATALGRSAEVERWLSEAALLAPQVALEGHSLLVLCLMAAARQASPAAKASLETGAERALIALVEGQLAWPAPDDAFAPGIDGPEWVPDPKRALLEQRLTALLGPERRTALAGQLARLADHRERQAAAFAALGPLPLIPAAPAASPARWQPLLERGPS